MNNKNIIFRNVVDKFEKYEYQSHGINVISKTKQLDKPYFINNILQYILYTGQYSVPFNFEKSKTYITIFCFPVLQSESINQSTQLDFQKSDAILKIFWRLASKFCFAMF